MAPELLLGKQYNEKVDVFSFAICMWELLTNNLPYAGMDLIGVVNFVVSSMMCRVLTSLLIIYL